MADLNQSITNAKTLFLNREVQPGLPMAKVHRWQNSRGCSSCMDVQ